jgi:hypothetical protein
MFLQQMLEGTFLGVLQQALECKFLQQMLDCKFLQQMLACMLARESIHLMGVQQLARD